MTSLELGLIDKKKKERKGTESFLCVCTVEIIAVNGNTDLADTDSFSPCCFVGFLAISLSKHSTLVLSVQLPWYSEMCLLLLASYNSSLSLLACRICIQAFSTEGFYPGDLLGRSDVTTMTT